MEHEDRWWALPGPSRFLKTLLDDLHSGRNVVVAWPQHHPAGWREALHDRLHACESFRVHLLRACEPPVGGPANYVLRNLLPNSRVVDPTPRCLLDREELRESVVILDSVPPDAAPIWIEFLDEYQRICREIPEHERLLFLIGLDGRAIVAAPRGDLALAVRRWQGCAGRLDMQLFESQFPRSDAPGRAELALHRALLVEFAGTDPELAEFLRKAELLDLLRPATLLAEYAELRGWSQGIRDASREELWMLGALDLRDDEWLAHAAFPDADKYSHSLQRRIWHAEVATLFPEVERVRRMFVEEYRGRLKVPFSTPFDTILEVDKLELSHILYQLSDRLTESHRGLLVAAKNIRNQLAHIAPANPDDVLRVLRT